MPYDPNIPASTDILSDSQSDIQQNFNLANEFFGTDHVDFVASSDNGKHNHSTYPEQGSDATTLDNENAIYAKEVGGNTRLFLRQETNGTIIQLTGRDPILAIDGLTFLPGGILLQWGRTGVVGDSVVVSYPEAFSTVFNVQITAISCPINSEYSTQGNPGNISFIVSKTGGGANVAIQWLAIGLA